MKSKIQEQVLKYLEKELGHNCYDKRDCKIAISRTIELMEEDLRCFVCDKKLKLTDYKCCDSCAVNYLNEQKADFRKMIDDVKNHNCLDYGKADWSCDVCEVCDKLLKKLGNNKELSK